MELIIFLIVICIAVANSQKGKEKSEQGRNSVWDQVEKSGSSVMKNFSGRAGQEQFSKGIRDLEDMINHVARKASQKIKEKEAASYQQEQQEYRKKEEAERRRRDFEERQKKKLELQKKQEENRRRQLEKERKAREEKEMLERFQTNTAKAEPLEQSKAPIAKDSLNGKKKENDSEQKTLFRTEEYLDPLTASFYPDVEDYLFPTIAPFYPDTDITSFSLQNKTNVL